jgi:hypothetical protein
VQFLGAALAALPFSVAAEGVPALPAGPGVVLAVAGLAAGGTLLPFTLFAYAQGRVSAEVAGAFLNLEPLVGAVAGVAFFGDPAGPVQLAGGVAILVGIALSSLPLLGAGRRGRATGERRQDTRRPRRRPRLLSQRPQPRSPQPRRPQPRSAKSPDPQPRSTQPRSPQPRSTQPRSPLRRRPLRRSPRHRNAPPRRPPPRPGSARRTAYRAAARACRWAFTGRRGRLRADRGAGARCRSGPVPVWGRCRSGAGEPLPPQGEAGRSVARARDYPRARGVPVTVHGGPGRQRVRH